MKTVSQENFSRTICSHNPISRSKRPLKLFTDSNLSWHISNCIKIYGATYSNCFKRMFPVNQYATWEKTTHYEVQFLINNTAVAMHESRRQDNKICSSLGKYKSVIICYLDWSQSTIFVMFTPMQHMTNDIIYNLASRPQYFLLKNM